MQETAISHEDKTATQSSPIILAADVFLATRNKEEAREKGRAEGRAITLLSQTTSPAGTGTSGRVKSLPRQRETPCASRATSGNYERGKLFKVPCRRGGWSTVTGFSASSRDRCHEWTLARRVLDIFPVTGLNQSGRCDFRGRRPDIYGRVRIYASQG